MNNIRKDNTNSTLDTNGDIVLVDIPEGQIVLKVRQNTISDVLCSEQFDRWENNTKKV